MAFVQFSKISLAFGDRDILKGVSLHLASGSRACLAGANGSGKSTLMKVMAGIIPADSGERSIEKNTRVSYLPQSGIVHSGKTLRDEAETAFDKLRALLAQADEIGKSLENKNQHERAVAALVDEHHRLLEKVEQSGYYRRDAKISLVLRGLGFSADDLERETGEFSGGWQMRIALAKVLLEQPDILLLDEPTNYLDIEARSWLEGWLADFSGGCLLVSHDRYFLDISVNEVYELFQGKLKRYAGNYTAYEKTRKIELESLVKRYEEQQEEIAKTEALIRRFRYKASKAAFAQELIGRLEKMERIEIPESLKKMHITFPPPPHSPRVAIALEGIRKSYGERQVLSGMDLSLDSGERLAVAGPNGAGKSTLLRIIAGADTDFEGTLKYGAGISAGYFSQDAAEAMNGSEQALEFMEANAPTALIPHVRDMLGAFLFRGDDVYKPVAVLSGGEKSRLALLRMLLKPMNLLILDEPTNHLDLHSKDILLETLNKFKGTIIFVSHDRAFMEALSSKTLELSPGAGPAEPTRARLFFGNYGYYLDRITAEKAADECAANKNASGKIAAGPLRETAFAGGTGTASGISDKSAAEQRLHKKQRQAALRRLERQESDLLAAIDELEKEKARLETELSRPEVYSNGEKAKALAIKLDECAVSLTEKNSQWEALAAELASLNNAP